MSAPLYDRLRKYDKNRISFAMPGHKNGRGLRNDLLSLDVTELPTTADLSHGSEAVLQAEENLSKLYGSDKSYILTGGSTSAIQAMICSATKPGGTLLAAADCHISVVNACAIFGINLKLFPKSVIAQFSVPDKTFSLEEYITDDVDAVIITSPNYYGICSDIKSIAKECHEKKVPLIVDEAHGAHFVSSDKFPETAVKYADAVCQSSHKTLNALTGSAYLHVNGNLIDRKRLKKSLYMIQSSSPSYPIAASADCARDELEYPENWENTHKMCCDFKNKIRDTKIKVLDNDDDTRIVLNFSSYEITGAEVEEKLSKFGIDIEMSDLYNIVLIVTTSNTQDDMDILYNALAIIVEKFSAAEFSVTLNPPPVCRDKIFPQYAFYSDSCDVRIENSVGKISSQTVIAYPPAIPIIYMGEKIRSEQIEYVKYIECMGIELTGIESGLISVVE